MIDYLEWSSFGLAMFAVLLYGRSKFWGSIAGLFASASFIFWGLLADVTAAFVFNFGFALLYARNLHIAIGERRVPRDRS